MTGPGAPGHERPIDPLSDAESKLFRDLIEAHCGLVHGLDSKLFLERRLRARMDALKLEGYLAYYQVLRDEADGGGELERLVESITTHETYFFRDPRQLDALRLEILPEIAERFAGRKRLRIWSAGCSSGEEVYTVAMLLRDDARFKDWVLRVVGSDLSSRVVRRAREAKYAASSFRATPVEARERHFEPADSGLRVAVDLRRICSFGQLNLLDTQRYGAIGRCDVILCRNVLMYLSPQARRRIVDGFYEALDEGGYLLLGHSESLLQLSTRFEIVHLANDLVYRKA